MNSSPFMDMQDTGLSMPQGGGDRLDFIKVKPLDKHQINGGGIMKDGVVSGYDFQPIHSFGFPTQMPPMKYSGLDGARPSSVASDSRVASAVLKYSDILEPQDLSRVGHGREESANDVAFVAEIDLIVKKYTDNVLQVLEGLSSRLWHLEIRSQCLQSSMDELESLVENNNGSIDGKLSQLEDTLVEVYDDVQDLLDKQDTVETQLQAILETTESLKTGHLDSQQQPAALPQQPRQKPHQLPTVQFATPNAYCPLPPQQIPGTDLYTLPLTSLVHRPPSPQIHYFPPPAQPTEATHLHYQVPSDQPQHSQYLQQPQLLQPVNSSFQLQTTLPHHPEEPAPYMPSSQAYTHQPQHSQYQPLQPVTSSSQLQTTPPHHHEEPAPYTPSSQTCTHQPQHSQYFQQPQPSQPVTSSSQPQTTLPHHPEEPAPYIPSSSPSFSGGQLPHLPTAKFLPEAPPTESNSGRPMKNIIGIDKLFKKVESMGFTNDQVRAAVTNLIENGKSVDLNVVLDKLMNK